MKIKFIIILFLIAICMGISHHRVYAQDLIPSGLPQPGVTCGNAAGTGDLQKCCQSTLITPAPLHFGDPALDAAIAVVQPILDKNTNAMVQKQKAIIIDPCMNGVPSTPGDISNPSCICIIGPTKEPLAALAPMCDTISKPEQDACKVCANKDAGVWTALGCFNGNLSDFIANNIMKTGIGLAGGISMLCIMFAAFQMQTSRGNAEKVKKAQELMTNCITGLMVIIFSVLILKIIGVDILRIPGFN